MMTPSGLNSPTVIKGMTLPYKGRTKTPFIYDKIKIYMINIYALRGSAWRCHVALRATSHPRGPRGPFFNFFIYIFIIKNRKFKSEKLGKIQKKSLKL